MSEVTVVDHDPSWASLFQRLQQPLADALRGLAVAIEHVGSTSVPGLAAKPIIDIDVVVPSPDDVARAITRLQPLGYQHVGDLGIPGREALKCRSEGPRHNLYVCALGNPALANHLAVRDHLRARPNVAAAYGRLKRQLAEQFPHDMAAYIEGKTPLLIQILRDEGFAQDVLDDIVARNRRP